MPTTTALLQSDLPDLQLVARGKVRDLYRVDENMLLFVATDRISAFDIILANGIPGKGKVLTQLSVFWFNLLREELARRSNGDVKLRDHLITADINEMPPAVQKYADQLKGRSMLVRSCSILPLEAIVRGYLSGSGLKEYRRSGTVCGIQLPSGLTESDKLPAALYTPSTKAELGAHDENIHPDRAREIVGDKIGNQVEKAAVTVYEVARDYAATKGIIIADTKFEFGLLNKGTAAEELVIVDEVLTPDSSRFWDAATYAPGKSQDSFDKQYIRDFLLGQPGFDASKPGKQDFVLPDDIVANTMKRYTEAFVRLTGKQPEL
ncbi:SAICAR synthetase [Ramicandelaber brevisporus]|nr:SAICAR synthetase [Ramicandelaber brevisporus]